MKLLVFGKTGQVAVELQRAAPEDWTTLFLGRDDANLEDLSQCAAAIKKFAPDIVINAAAYTAVDKAEKEEALAHRINAEAPQAMALAAGDIGAAFLHISTDYVFDGTGQTAFGIDHSTGPLGAYGRTKLAGELGIAEIGGQWLVLRTSWVISGHGANFVGTMLRLGAERTSLNVVDDQVGGPTPARSIATALIECARQMRGGKSGGIFHFAGAPDVSWAEFARAIMDQAGLDCRIDAIPSSDYPTPAKRPGNSRLDCSAIEQHFGITRPDWREELPAIITELQQ